MWIFPLVAAVVAAVFAILLTRQFVSHRRSYQALWAVAMLMFAVASFMVFLGVVGHWTKAEFAVFWLLGAVLNVPFLAAGEVELLVRNRTVRAVTLLLLAFAAGYAVARIRGASFDLTALRQDLPSGKEVFGAGTPAHRLPQLIAIPSYVILVLGAIWSAWRMRGRPELRDRFLGTLGIAAGATIVAGFASAFAAAGNALAFSISLAAGVAVMFWGFLRASRSTNPATAIEAPSS
jgi:hypothetical protein